MKTIDWFKPKPNLLLLILLFCTGTFLALPAFSQIDYTYGLNRRGFRLGVGAGITDLSTHFNSNPPQTSFVANLDYAFSRYFVIGFESDFGKFKGIDDVNHTYFQSSTSSYYNYNFNMKASLGTLIDFEATSGLKDAIKRFYLGGGYGITARSFATLTTHSPPSSATMPEVLKQAAANLPTFFFDLGTFIDVPGAFGADKIEICPNYQFNFVNSYYLDGFRNSLAGGKSAALGFYAVTSISLRYKF